MKQSQFVTVEGRTLLWTNLVIPRLSRRAVQANIVNSLYTKLTSYDRDKTFDLGLERNQSHNSRPVLLTL